MTDTNIIVSAILYPASIISEMIKHIISNENLVICQYSIDEINVVFAKKFPQKMNKMKMVIEKLPYELFALNEIKNKKYPQIRDINDLPVLANAIEAKVDMLITGDKDFDDVIVENLIILNPRKYIDRYILNHA